MTKPGISGFTIVELMLASMVFSLVMLAALTGFMLVGRIFYQGVTLTQTQNTAQKIVNDISANISTADSTNGVTGPVQSFKIDNANHYTYYCVGQARYTYTYTYDSSGNQIPIQVNSSNKPNYGDGSQGGNFGLLRDILPGSSPCAPPCWKSGSFNNCVSGDVQFINPVEMLASDMRLSAFNIDPAANQPGLYKMSLTVTYGNDSDLNNPDSAQPACVGGTSHNQFCAVVALNTSIYQGLHS